MTDSVGLVHMQACYPSMLPWRAKAPVDTSISTSLQYLNNEYKRIQREDFFPITLGHPDVVESIELGSVYEHIRSMTDVIFRDTIQQHFIDAEDSDKIHILFTMARQEPKDGMEAEISADRFISIFFNGRNDGVPYAFVIPIFSKVEQVGGENPHFKRKFYYHLANEKSISLYLYAEQDRTFIRPDERSDQIGGIAKHVLRAMVEQCCVLETEYPIAAATYLEDVVFWVDRPMRHHDVLFSKEFQEHKAKNPDSPIIQGFLTNHRNFVNRKRAMHMAAAAKSFQDPLSIQLSSQMEILYSEKELEKAEDDIAYRTLRFHGIHQDEDKDRYGYLLRSIALFSEDLW